MTKEEIYDSQINPLMAQIIAICQEHKIANVCSFSLDREGLCCTTYHTTDDYEPPEAFLECVRILYPHPKPVSMLTVRDGDGKVKEAIAFLD